MAELKHYGMPRRSGRYPWGSGDDAYQRSAGWKKYYKELKDQGLSDLQIAEGEGINTNQLRNRNTISREEVRSHERNRALQLKDKGYSDTEIGRQMGKNESSIRSLLDPVLAERASITRTTANMLRESVDKDKFIDIGVGIENHIGVTRTKLNSAVSILEEEGYKVHTVNVPQLGMPGKFTIMKVLGTPDTEWKDLVKDTSQIKSLAKYSDDGGRSFEEKGMFDPKKIQYVNSERIKVRYAEEGGTDKDGVMELRRGVKDLDLGGSQYAQVRIGVDGTHFLKGMAIYSDNMPDGVDIVFNTNKHSDVGKMNAMKSSYFRGDKFAGALFFVIMLSTIGTS
jgi:DNA-binding CsgD family transcriptional regulator